MSNTLTFKVILHIEFSEARKQVSCVDMIVDGLVHTITAGDVVTAIVVDGNNVYFYNAECGHFYTLPGGRIYDERLRYSFSFQF